MNEWDVAEKAYSDEVISEIAERYNFSAEKTNFKDVIHKGAVYFEMFSESDANYTPEKLGAEQKHLEKEVAKIRQFQEALGLESYSRRKLKEPAPNPFMEKVLEIAYAAMRHQNPSILEVELYRLQHDRTQLSDALTQILYDDEDQIDDLKGRRRGRPSNRTTFEFVSRLSRFWQSELKRPLKFDSHQGELLTDAAHFIKDCAEPLVPLTNSQVISMMRKVRG